MSPKYALQYILEKLKDRAKLALKDPKLIEIAKTAPLNAKREPNLTWVYDKAFYMLWDKFMIKKSRELATSTRFLAMLRRDYPEEFEKLILAKEPIRSERTQEQELAIVHPMPSKETIERVQEKVEKLAPEPPEKKFEEIELEIPHFVELITIESMQSHLYTVPLKKRLMRFPNEYSWSCVWSFCLNILNKMVERELSKNFKKDFKECFINDLAAFIEKNFGIEPLIEILEKRGLKIKICGNCFYRCRNSVSNDIYCGEHATHFSNSFDSSCEAWKAPSKN